MTHESYFLMFQVEACTSIKTGNPPFFKSGIRLSLNDYTLSASLHKHRMRILYTIIIRIWSRHS